MVKKTNAIILTKIYDILSWIIPQVDKFPRSQRFFLGSRIENLLLDILEQIIEAVYTKEKKSLLHKANVNLEKLRFLVRLAKDLSYLSIKKYEYLAKSIDEVGKMLGGWIKQSEKRGYETGR